MAGLDGYRAAIHSLEGGTAMTNLMTRVVLLAAIAISLVVPVAAADVGSSKKHRYYRHQAVGPVFPYGAAQAPAVVRRHGPPWAMPNECFNDEGYGRWSTCGGRFN